MHAAPSIVPRRQRDASAGPNERPHRARSGARGKFCTARGGSAARNRKGEKTMTLLIYLVGWIIFIGGVAWGLTMLHVAQHVIAIVAVILFGIAVITGATRARNRDRS
jgi:predicted membrane channel-forming protein YqfA (hemolysin III family)